MKTSKGLELEKDIVTSIAELVPSKWTMLVLNFEVIEGSTGSPITDRICFWVNESGKEFHNGNLSLTPEIVDKVLSLRQEVSLAGESWSVCDLTVLSSGVYDFQFRYETPKRLNGEFDFDSLFRYDSHKDEYLRRIDIVKSASS